MGSGRTKAFDRGRLITLRAFLKSEHTDGFSWSKEDGQCSAAVGLRDLEPPDVELMSEKYASRCVCVCVSVCVCVCERERESA